MDPVPPAVRLRVPTHEDAFTWHRIFADPDVREFHGGRAAELSVHEELTARRRRHDAELGSCLWTVVDGADRVIGFTGAQPWERDRGPTGEIEIGRRLGRERWGKGYAIAAGRRTPERVRATACVTWSRWPTPATPARRRSPGGSGCASTRRSRSRPRTGRATATG